MKKSHQTFKDKIIRSFDSTKSSSERNKIDNGKLYQLMSSEDNSSATNIEVTQNPMCELFFSNSMEEQIDSLYNDNPPHYKSQNYSFNNSNSNTHTKINEKNSLDIRAHHIPLNVEKNINKNIGEERKIIDINLTPVVNYDTKVSLNNLSTKNKIKNGSNLINNTAYFTNDNYNLNASNNNCNNVPVIFTHERTTKNLILKSKTINPKSDIFAKENAKNSIYTPPMYNSYNRADDSLARESSLDSNNNTGTLKSSADMRDMRPHNQSTTAVNNKKNGIEKTHSKVSSANQTSSAPVVAISPNYHLHHRQRAGIYGWRKRCLYFWILLLTTLALLNLALTAWLMRLLRFHWRGMGNIRFTPTQTFLNGQTIFQKPIHIANIESPQNGNLNLKADRNIILNAMRSDNTTANTLSLGPDGLIAQGPRFEVRNTQGQTIFAVTPDNMTIRINTLNVNGKYGAKFRESLQTPLIRSPPSEPLRIESLNRPIEFEANGLDIKTLAGPLSILALTDISFLSSQGGKIMFKGGAIHFPNLIEQHAEKTIEFENAGNVPTQLPQTTNVNYKGIFQVCLCENGKLFIALPEHICMADPVFCN